MNYYSKLEKDMYQELVKTMNFEKLYFINALSKYLVIIISLNIASTRTLFKVLLN